MLNNCKYGVSTHGNEIRLTLLKSPLMPDQYADQRMQQFTYSFCPFDGPFADSDVLQQATELNEPPILGAVCAAHRPIFLPDAKNIIVETIKPADTVENALLVRAYEAMGVQTDCAFEVHDKVQRVIETDMLEENGADVDVKHIRFGPFEIKTFILQL